MNVLFLIGNGFDLNLGMATRYENFYKYYTAINSESQIIKKFKQEISGNIQNWSDMERKFGEYTKNINSEHEFVEIYDDLSDKLADYLQSEEDKFEYDKIDTQELYKYLIFPENSLPEADKEILQAFKNKVSNSIPLPISVITFNYTKSFENLSQYRSENQIIGKRGNVPVMLKRMEHIHGYLDDRMVLGVNDIRQISNTEFQTNQNVLNDLVKSLCNKAQKHKIDDWAKQQILEANLIFIFGSSIGDTDNLWWELIGEQLKRQCFLVIFEKGEIISPRRPQRKVISEMDKRNYFLDKTKLKAEERENASSKIIIGFNTDMFDFGNKE